MTMILTYKLLHNMDFSQELIKARKIAEYAVKHRTFSSKDVKHIGLKSAIANQILRKYGKNKVIRQIKSIKLTIPNQSIKLDRQSRTITIPCLKNKYSFQYRFPRDFEKVNQIEIGEQYVYVSVSAKEVKIQSDANKYLGVDLNTTGHIAVASNPNTGEVWKLGKIAEHIHTKYKHIRKELQKQGKYRKVKQIKDRESRIARNLNHHISKKIVYMAVKAKSGIKLEKLNNIRNGKGKKKHAKSFRYSLNSWSFYQLQKFIEYKANLQGIIVEYIDPRYTSKTCSRCGHIGKRDDKRFECLSCRHVDHGDVNASFNIGKPISYCVISSTHRDQFNVERDTLKASTDTAKSATLSQETTETLEPLKL